VAYRVRTDIHGLNASRRTRTSQAVRGGAILCAIALALAVPAVRIGAQAPASPFAVLERDIRGEVALERAKIAKGQGAEEKLEALYGILHDIRNYQAFQELWQAWGWSKPQLDALYVGSGSHIAPLVFLETGTLKRARFTFTEVDPHAPARLEAMLGLMQTRGVFTGLTVHWRPVDVTSLTARWKAALAGPDGEALQTSLDAFVPWYGRAADDLKVNPGFEVFYRFRAGACEVELRMLVGATEAKEGSTACYRLSDFQKADLFITHDWDSSPRGNLALLLEVLSSYPRGDQERPLAVMMEDLEKYPYPVDMEIFHPVARSKSGYGHVEYAHLPSGRRLLAEDGATLYGGGVILQPDTRYFNALPPERLEALFDLLLFAPGVYDRFNVDVIGGRRVSAPPILDIDVGYGYRDVRGRDLRGSSEFPQGLAGSAIALVSGPPTPPAPVFGALCGLLTLYRSALEVRAGRDVSPLLSCDGPGVLDNPFLTFQQARQKFDHACAHKSEIAARLDAEKPSFAQASALLARSAPRSCFAGSPPGSRGDQADPTATKRERASPGAETEPQKKAQETARTGLRGRTLMGPMCPGPARLDRRCPDRPFAADIEIVDAAGKRIIKARSDDEGRYEVSLPPGQYTVRLLLDESVPLFQRASTEPIAVTVAAGEVVEADLHLDTGMR
jgi:hypothetical protein